MGCELTATTISPLLNSAGECQPACWSHLQAGYQHFQAGLDGSNDVIIVTAAGFATAFFLIYIEINVQTLPYTIT